MASSQSVSEEEIHDGANPVSVSSMFRSTGLLAPAEQAGFEIVAYANGRICPIFGGPMAGN
jgi:hypothetical protein